MRVLLASIFVVVGSIAMAVGVQALGIDIAEDRLFWGTILALLWLALVSLAAFLFKARGTGIPAPSIEELEAQGLIETKDFVARRAIQVEAYGDEGSHLLLELDDGRILYLGGPYLDDGLPIIDEPDPERNQPREFPATEFTILRHKKEGHVLDIRCRGLVLEPELVAWPFTREVWDSGLIPLDGEYVAGKTFDELKTLLSQPGQFEQKPV
jgi:hypothetical protein